MTRAEHKRRRKAARRPIGPTLREQRLSHKLGPALQRARVAADRSGVIFERLVARHAEQWEITHARWRTARARHKALMLFERVQRECKS